MWSKKMLALTSLLPAAVLMAGCASQKDRPLAEHERIGTATPALAFTPEVTMGDPVVAGLDLAREGRGAATVAGFRSPVITTNVVQLRDRFRSTPHGNYDRVDKFTLSTRTYTQVR